MERRAAVGVRSSSQINTVMDSALPASSIVLSVPTHQHSRRHQRQAQSQLPSGCSPTKPICLNRSRAVSCWHGLVRTGA